MRQRLVMLPCLSFSLILLSPPELLAQSPLPLLMIKSLKELACCLLFPLLAARHESST